MMLESLGHMLDPDASIEEAKRVQISGGVIHIMANAEDFPAIGYRGYSAEQLVALLIQHGFEQVTGFDAVKFAYAKAKKPLGRSA